MRLAIALVVAGLAVAGGMAQVKISSRGEIAEVLPLDLPLVDPKLVPDNAMFFMATYAADGNPVPWPYNPLAGLDVPIFSLAGISGAGSSHLLVDDRYIGGVDKVLAALHQLELAANGAAQEAAAPAPQYAARGLAPVSDGLQLDIEEATNGVVSVSILNATGQTNPPGWDVWGAVALSGNPDAWQWLAQIGRASCRERV